MHIVSPGVGSLLCVRFFQSTGDVDQYTVFCTFNGYSFCYYLTQNSFKSRQMQISDAGVQFYDCRSYVYNGSGYTTTNDMLIPQNIIRLL